MSSAQIGVTGLAVMGRNLARNFARHGHAVALHNRTQARTDSLVAEHGSGRWRSSSPRSSPLAAS
jgi:6-phosphogluconate dehydrogenase